MGINATKLQGEIIMMKTLSKLDQEVARTLNIAREKFPDHSFLEPKVRMDLTGKVAGVFSNKPTPSIRFNLALMLENKEIFLKSTVPHEVAHFVVNVIAPNELPHGVVWQAIMKLFGVSNPKTYHSYKVAPPKRRKRPYIYRCSCQEHLFTKQKHGYVNRGVSYTCRRCKGICEYIGKKD